jgi:hypothetical protein
MVGHPTNAYRRLPDAMALQLLAAEEVRRGVPLMSDSQAGPSIVGIFAGSLGFILCAVCIVGFFVAGFAIDYIDQRIEDDCDSTTGEIAQITGADEGQCDEGSTTRDLLAAIKMPLLVLGIIFGLLAGFATYQN